MTRNGQFSWRHGFRPETSPLAYDSVSDVVREEFRLIFLEYFDADDPSYPYLARRLRKRLTLETRTALVRSGDEGWFGIEEILLKSKWFEFYDICEEIRDAIDRSGIDAGQFEDDINDLLYEGGLGYRMKDGRIGRLLPPQVDEQIESARRLLDGPKFEGANSQFEKAMRFFSMRPKPDTENCVKDAVGAVEAVTRILSGDPKLKLSDALGKEPFRSGIHPTLRVAIEKLYAYRGDLGGVAHGQVGPSQVGIEEAEWALTTALAAILYLVKKFGHLRE